MSVKPLVILSLFLIFLGGARGEERFKFDAVARIPLESDEVEFLVALEVRVKDGREADFGSAQKEIGRVALSISRLEESSGKWLKVHDTGGLIAFCNYDKDGKVLGGDKLNAGSYGSFGVRFVVQIKEDDIQENDEDAAISRTITKRGKYRFSFKLDNGLKKIIDVSIKRSGTDDYFEFHSDGEPTK